MVRKAETFPPVTMGHVRGRGARANVRRGAGGRSCDTRSHKGGSLV
jgi:hypothetical protein